MQMLSCSRPSLRQDQPRHSRHLSLRSKRVSLLNCFEFLLGSNFSERLEGRLDFLPTVY